MVWRCTIPSNTVHPASQLSGHLPHLVQGLSTYAPDAKQALLEPSAAKLKSIAENLTTLKVRVDGHLPDE